jgi:hypothetical protein
MKSKKFIIPQELIAEFAQQVVDSQLINQIVDVNDDVLTIEIKYDADEKTAVYDIIEWAEDNIETSGE